MRSDPRNTHQVSAEEEKNMSRPGLYRQKSSVHFTVLAIIYLAIITLAFCSPAYAQTKKPASASKQTTFASSDEAVMVFIDAVKANETKKLLSMLGPGSEKIISSGDPVADRHAREQFVKRYEERNRIETHATKWVLYVGKDDWPFPIPIVKQGGSYRFDAKAGKEEILARRIGKNELSAIQVCLACTDAQRDYALKDRDSDGLLEYAQKFMSAPGKKDGLYWDTTEGEQESPLGPVFAATRERGYKKATPGGKPVPYYGYHYRILKAQGKSAPGGAYDYIVNGKMIGGFALVAYPAQYGSSGVMTFIVNQDGIVHQKDLGKNTQKIAQAVKAYNPDRTWKKVE
jgi:hypothetical protein